MLDFSNAEHVAFSSGIIIPAETICPVRLLLENGGYNFGGSTWPSIGKTGSVYLKASYTVTEGPYKGVKFYGLIGLFSQKSGKYAAKGAYDIRKIIESANGISHTNEKAKREITSHGDLNGCVFLAEVGTEEKPKGGLKNILTDIITIDDPRHIDFKAIPTANLRNSTPTVDF